MERLATTCQATTSTSTTIAPRLPPAMNRNLSGGQCTSIDKKNLRVEIRVERRSIRVECVKGDACDVSIDVEYPHCQGTSSLHIAICSNRGATPAVDASIANESTTFSSESKNDVVPLSANTGKRIKVPNRPPRRKKRPRTNTENPSQSRRDTTRAGMPQLQTLPHKTTNMDCRNPRRRQTIWTNASTAGEGFGDAVDDMVRWPMKGDIETRMGYGISASPRSASVGGALRGSGGISANITSGSARARGQHRRVVHRLYGSVDGGNGMKKVMLLKRDKGKGTKKDTVKTKFGVMEDKIEVIDIMKECGTTKGNYKKREMAKKGKVDGGMEMIAKDRVDRARSIQSDIRTVLTPDGRRVSLLEDPVCRAVDKALEKLYARTEEDSTDNEGVTKPVRWLSRHEFARPSPIKGCRYGPCYCKSLSNRSGKCGVCVAVAGAASARKVGVDGWSRVM